MDIELLYFEGCPHWQVADSRLAEIAAERGLTVRHRLVTTPLTEPVEAAPDDYAYPTFHRGIEDALRDLVG